MEAAGLLHELRSTIYQEMRGVTKDELAASFIRLAEIGVLESAILYGACELTI
jgi:hypothetical protein